MRTATLQMLPADFETARQDVLETTIYLASAGMDAAMLWKLQRP